MTGGEYSDTAGDVRNHMSGMPHLLDGTTANTRWEKEEIWEIIATKVASSGYSSAVQVVGAGGKLSEYERVLNP
ncbi:MAG TPA: hypothetical protein DCX53_12470 [Anaerolineae bacterium]|nr:hypothetical protein [Anaerolineae bacterium]